MDHLHGRKQVASPEVAIANEVFDQFCNASTLKSILGYYRHLCDLLKLRPTTINQFYPKLKSKLKSWKAQALWKKFDQRANHKCYNRGKACSNTRVLIIGGGPCGLRSAIEAQLLGAKVVVVEKRDRMSRNNVLHLWPFVIQDLRSLGAKKFFGKFCAGSIDHISIRQLQCILLKVALILGVEFHENVSFDALLLPPGNQEDEKIGWRAKLTPLDHPVSQYEFDVLIGADGKRNTLDGFKRKEFRGKLAIAITANFINKRTEAEARVEEISGVAFIFNQKFFKELYQDTGIDLENIVYYKDDTHYFVMTAKKHSLIDKGVILQDHADTAKLLDKENVDREALMLYAREAAEFSTEYQMMDLEFAVNHYGQPDVAMFDFTSMYAAENASRIIERQGHRLFMTLVGDSLLEPFWPTGSGCARGFLSSLDACWAIKGWGASLNPLEVLAERESIYRLLGQTTPENLNRDYAAYTLDPHTRYPNLNIHSVTPIQVRSLLDTDDPESVKQPSILSPIDVPKKRRRRDNQIHPETLLLWLKKQVDFCDSIKIDDMGTFFKNGLALCAIIHRYRPDLIDFHSLKCEEVAINNQLAFDILEKEFNISPIMTGEEMSVCQVPDKLIMFSYLTQLYENFRGEIPYIKHPKLKFEEGKEEKPTFSKYLSQFNNEQKVQHIGRISKHETTRSRHTRTLYGHENLLTLSEKMVEAVGKRPRKRRSTEKMGATVDREPKMHMSHYKRNVDNEFSGRIKNIEDKLKGSISSEKKPKDLLRAIGKIEKTDWNVKEIEKKIEENKMGRGQRSQDKMERVPKWSREQFLARQIKMEKKGHDSKELESKYADIDNTLKTIDRKIKEGNILGHNKVSAMAEQFANKNQDAEPKVQRLNSKVTIALPTQGGSEMCHFCNKRVYLMERLSAEGKFFHRGCFRCEYCSISLRIGNHTFDRGKNNGRFYCLQHLGLPGTMKTRMEKKKVPVTNKENIPNVSSNIKTSDKPKVSLEGVTGLDLLDRGQTPERIEFENLARVSDAEEAHSQMDEDEWTDRNFGASAAELGSSDDDISDLSDSEEENEVFEEAIDQPLTTEGTLELAKNWTLRYSQYHPSEEHSDTGSNEYEDSTDECSSEDEDSATATENEDDVRARELRKQEVWLKVPSQSSDTDTGSETEVASNEESTEESEENSATEISTDSEFEHDGTTPTQHEIPKIAINDAFVRKTRGDYVEPKIVQVKSHMINSTNGNLLQEHTNSAKSNISRITNVESIQNQDNVGDDDGNSNFKKNFTALPFNPLVSSRTGDYLLNRTHSTEGIASKLSLELKKRYLLGGLSLGGSAVKSASTSNVDTKLRNLTDSISQHQKLLNPAPEPSPTMQAFLQGTNKIVENKAPSHSPLSSVTSFFSPLSKSFSIKSNISSIEETNFQPINALEISKTLLPDLIKESSILKSKTDPNITFNIDNKDKSDKNHCKKVVKDNVYIEEREEGKGKYEENTVEKSEMSFKKECKGEKLEINHSKEKNDKNSRPTSPLYEACIIVPQVNWSKKKNNKKKSRETSSSDDSLMDSDSLLSTHVEVNFKDKHYENEDNRKCKEREEQIKMNLKVLTNLSPPTRLQIHSTNGDLLLDEIIINNREKEIDDMSKFEPDSIECARLENTSVKEPLPLPSSSSSPSPPSPPPLPPPVNDFVRNSKFIKNIEIVNNNLKQLELQDDRKSICSSSTSIASLGYNRQDDSDENDVTTTAAYTETEYSDWARDGDAIGSKDIRDVDFEIDSDLTTLNKSKHNISKTNAELSTDDGNVVFSNNDALKLLANGDDLDFMDTDNESLLDDSLQEASNNALLKNRGYIEFVNFKTSTPTKFHKLNTSAPIAKIEVENDDLELEICDNINVININPITMDDVIDKLNGGAINKFVKVPNLADKSSSSSSSSNSSSSSSSNSSGSSSSNKSNCKMFDNLNKKESSDNYVANNKESMLQSMEEDSLLIVEPAEDTITTTTSELTTVVSASAYPLPILKQDGEESLKTELIQVAVDDESNNTGYLEYVKRLQSRIAEFSNAKDSIDIRKSKRKTSKPLIQNLRTTVDAITEEIKDKKSLENNYNTPTTLRKLEEITRERCKQKDLIQDLLMDQLEAHKQKSAEKKAKRAARASSFSNKSLSPAKNDISSSSIAPTKFIPMSISSPNNTLTATTFTNFFITTTITTTTTTTTTTTAAAAAAAAAASTSNTTITNITFAESKKALFEEIQNSDKEQSYKENKILSVFKPINQKKKEDSPSCKSQKKFAIEEIKHPIAPPRIKHEEAKKTTEKAKQDARERAKLKSDQDLGLSPEDRMKELRMKMARRQLYCDERKKRMELKIEMEEDIKLRQSHNSTYYALKTSKSTDNFKAITRKKTNFDVITSPKNSKSMDELLQTTDSKKGETTCSCVKRDKKKAKDSERRKSIIQAVSDFFKKKDLSLSPTIAKDKLFTFRLTPKSKEKGKVDKNAFSIYDARPKSVTEGMLVESYFTQIPPSSTPPPPLPPLPINYAVLTANISEDGSLSDEDSKTTALSASHANKTAGADDSCSSIPRKIRAAKRLARQTQLKRLRMAQEIQRKLEETEVKQRELEGRGVSVEKALRGEGDCSDREESDLLREWFDLMRERSELRRYEKELLVRAQEVQLEDRHERLQQELRERLADDDNNKTSADVKKEGEILTEMLEIVAKRDSLIALLEEERQRYQDEDRDLEAQMLAKGLRLTPVKTQDLK